MMYLLTMDWPIAITPEQSATSGDDLSIRSARAGHSRSMCLSSPKAPACHSVTEPAHTPVARQTQIDMLLNWQQTRPHMESQNSLQFRSAHRDLADLSRPDLEDEKASGKMCTASNPDQGKTNGSRAQRQRWPAAAFEKPVAPIASSTQVCPLRSLKPLILDDEDCSDPIEDEHPCHLCLLSLCSCPRAIS